MFAGSRAPTRPSLLAASATAGVCGLILLAAGSRQVTPAAEPQDAGSPPSAKRTEGDEAPPIFVKKIPPGYRDWRLISVAHEEGNLNSFAAVLGNDVAIKAYREEKVPFPDGKLLKTQLCLPPEGQRSRPGLHSLRTLERSGKSG